MRSPWAAPPRAFVPRMASVQTTLTTPFVTHHPGELIASADINAIQTATAGTETAVTGPVMRSARAYANLTAAVAACSDGDILEIPPGTYVTDPLVVTGKVVHFRGRRGARVQLRAGANASLLTISGPAAAGSTVTGGTWDGNRAAQTGVTNPNQDAVILITEADDCTVERARIQGGYVHGVFAYHCVGTRVLHNDIDDCDGLSTGTFPLGAIGAVRATDGFLAQANRITRCNGCGIKITAYDGVDPTAVTDAPRVLWNRIDYTGSTVANDNCLAIEVWGAVPRSEIVGNTVIGPNMGTHRIYGISVAVGDDSVIALNTCRRMLSLGIEVAGSNGCAVGTNTVTDANIGMSVSSGSATASRCSLTGNTIRDTHTAGMQIYGNAHAWAITGNTFTDCVGDALLLNGAGRGTVITGNVFTILAQAGALFGIHLYNASGVMIGPNTALTDPNAAVMSAGLCGIYVQGGSDVTIEGGRYDGRNSAGVAMAYSNISLENVTRPVIRGASLVGAYATAIVNTAGTTAPIIEDCPGWNYGTAAPTANYHYQGEKVHNTAPAAGGTVGWVCTTAGTPGTWKAYGTIAA